MIMTAAPDTTIDTPMGMRARIKALPTSSTSAPVRDNNSPRRNPTE